MMSWNQQEEENLYRLYQWHRRYLEQTGCGADLLSHIEQKRRGLVFPLPGRWPTEAELVRGIRPTEPATRPPERNPPSSTWTPSRVRELIRSVRDCVQGCPGDSKSMPARVAPGQSNGHVVKFPHHHRQYGGGVMPTGPDAA